jgi:hypothetical protein
MKLYLAAPYAAREATAAAAVRLRAAGWTITSTWHDLPEVDQDMATDYELSNAARQCCEEIAEAEALMLFASDDTSTFGRHVEFGYALAKDKKLFLVGICESIFQYLPAVFQVGTLDEFLSVMK